MGVFGHKKISWQVKLDMIMRTREQSRKIPKRSKRKEIIPIQEIGLTSKQHQQIVLWALITQKIYEYSHSKKINQSRSSLEDRDFCFYTSFYLGNRRKQFFIHTWLWKKKMFPKRRYSRSSSSKLPKVQTLAKIIDHKST